LIKHLNFGFDGFSKPPKSYEVEVAMLKFSLIIWFNFFFNISYDIECNIGHFL
jgi:hypothetical protein